METVAHLPEEWLSNSLEPFKTHWQQFKSAWNHLKGKPEKRSESKQTERVPFLSTSLRAAIRVFPAVKITPSAATCSRQNPHKRLEKESPTCPFDHRRIERAGEEEKKRGLAQTVNEISDREEEEVDKRAEGEVANGGGEGISILSWPCS